ncbi:MAG: type I-C CRISPR-associated protein Cas8c/Csd1 [Lachnospiraceae bacterium]|nr:type I-C CRISPR-associated protein Cas8c/Csd1 [Lachnospiraceae bacterium]
MIINALSEHYDVLKKDDKSGISSPGFQKTYFNYTAVLSEQGELFEVISHVVDKKKPQSAIMPETMKSSAVGSSPVCDNMSYIFGVDDGKGKGIQKFNVAKELHLKLFESAVSKEGIAVRLFFENWKPETVSEREEITKHFLKGISPPGNVVFKLVGETKHFHESDEVKEIWLNENSKKSAENEECIAQCAITGDITSIATLHTQFKGVKGAQPTGASLICFNKTADESYNLKQSHNSRVSEIAMFKYTTSLQWLLSSAENKLFIGDDTCVFWANSQNYKQYEETAFSLLFGINDNDEPEENQVERIVETRVKAILLQGSEGIYTTSDFNPDTNFYVLGLAPNAGRVSVRYFYCNTFAEFCNKIKRYYDETQVIGNLKNIKIRRLIDATISTKSKDKKVNPLLGGAVMRAVLSGSRYPQILFNQVILRVKTEKHVTQERAAAIKAFLIRNYKEEILPMLDEQSTNSAYVLGRTFAILEMIQKNSVEGKLNATIKDKYFATACSNPALVFPTLLKLTQHHLAKFDGVFWDKKLGDCLKLVASFPKAQNMENQGQFILGYYHQTQKNYEKRTKEENNVSN